MAQELLTRLRANKDLKNIPFTLQYMFNRVKMYARTLLLQYYVDDKQTKINKWNKIDEISALFTFNRSRKI